MVFVARLEMFEPDGFSWESTVSAGSFCGTNQSESMPCNCPINKSSKKAERILGWKAILNFEKTILMTSDWYKQYILKSTKMAEVSEKQIKYYQKLLK